jgi:hypothetical protein
LFKVLAFGSSGFAASLGLSSAEIDVETPTAELRSVVCVNFWFLVLTFIWFLMLVPHADFHLVPHADFHLDPRADFHPDWDAEFLGFAPLQPLTSTTDRMVGSTTTETLV